jgi:hypothetical protein
MDHDLFIRLAPSDVVYLKGENEIKNQLRLWVHNPGYAGKKRFVNRIGLTPHDPLPELDEYTAGLTMFGIFFPYGTRMGQLTSEVLAERITVEAIGNEHTWYCVHDYTSQYGHVWKIFPEEEIELLPGESLQFLISGLVVDSVPGLSSMYIKEKGNPQVQSVQLYKKPAPRILEMNHVLVCDSPRPYATLSWKVENASYCMVTPGDGVRYAPNGTMNLQGVDKVGNVTYTLQAFVDDVDTPLDSKEFEIQWKPVRSSSLQLISGNISPGYNTNSDWKLHIVDKRDQSREYRVYVGFPQEFVRVAPQVMVALTAIDVDHGRNLRVIVQAENVTTSGFTIVITTWWDTILFAASVSWMAYG